MPDDMVAASMDWHSWQMWPGTKAAICLLLLVAVVAKLLWNKHHCRTLARLPGPTLAAYTKYWRVYSVFRGHAHLDMIELHRKYGPIVRTAPNVVDIADPNAIAQIYGPNHQFTKTAFYPIQSISWRKKPELNVFGTRDPQEHREAKRKVGNAYTMSNLLQAEPKVDECTELLMFRLRDLSNVSWQGIDLGAWLQYYAFDVIGELTFARKLGFLEQGRDVDSTMHSIEVILMYAALTGQAPEWHSRLLGNPLITKLAPAMESWNSVLAFTIKCINSRTTFERDAELQDTQEEGIDMLSRWWNVKSSNPAKMSTRDVVVHTSTNVFAGSDTTAIALRSIVYNLCRHPDKMAIVRREIEEADRTGKLSRPISYQESSTHLPYFGAVLKEAMRLHSSVGLLMERHVPPEGANICGVDLPGGTIVGINPWCLNYDPSIFHSPEQFIPERWLDETNPEKRKLLESILDFNFGAGARRCLGRNISMMEMHKVLPELYRQFDVELTQPDKPWKTKNYWFVQQRGLICTLTPR